MAQHNLVHLSVLRPSDPMVIIEIGPEHKKFQVSKALLAQHSSLFNRALQNHPTASPEHKVVFEDLSPRAFKIFLSWLHTGEMPDTTEEWVQHCPGIHELNHNLAVNMLRLKTWVVAERLGAAQFLILINNHYVENNFTAPWLAEIIYAFAHIPHDRRILNLLVDCHCKGSISRSDLADIEGEDVQHQLPVEFFLRVMDRYAYMRKYADGGDEQVPMLHCDYHEHATEEEREECREVEEEEMWM